MKLVEQIYEFFVCFQVKNQPTSQTSIGIHLVKSNSQKLDIIMRNQVQSYFLIFPFGLKPTISMVYYVYKTEHNKSVVY